MADKRTDIELDADDVYVLAFEGPYVGDVLDKGEVK